MLPAFALISIWLLVESLGMQMLAAGSANGVIGETTILATNQSSSLLPQLLACNKTIDKVALTNEDSNASDNKNSSGTMDSFSPIEQASSRKETRVVALAISAPGKRQAVTMTFSFVTNTSASAAAASSAPNQAEYNSPSLKLAGDEFAAKVKQTTHVPAFSTSAPHRSSAPTQALENGSMPNDVLHLDSANTVNAAREKLQNEESTLREEKPTEDYSAIKQIVEASLRQHLNSSKNNIDSVWSELIQNPKQFADTFKQIFDISAVPYNVEVPLLKSATEDFASERQTIDSKASIIVVNKTDIRGNDDFKLSNASSTDPADTPVSSTSTLPTLPQPQSIRHAAKSNEQNSATISEVNKTANMNTPSLTTGQTKTTSGPIPLNLPKNAVRHTTISAPPFVPESIRSQTDRVVLPPLQSLLPILIKSSSLANTSQNADETNDHDSSADALSDSSATAKQGKEVYFASPESHSISIDKRASPQASLKTPFSSSPPTSASMLKLNAISNSLTCLTNQLNGFSLTGQGAVSHFALSYIREAVVNSSCRTTSGKTHHIGERWIEGQFLMDCSYLDGYRFPLAHCVRCLDASFQIRSPGEHWKEGQNLFECITTATGLQLRMVGRAIIVKQNGAIVSSSKAQSQQSSSPSRVISAATVQTQKQPSVKPLSPSVAVLPVNRPSLRGSAGKGRILLPEPERHQWIDDEAPPNLPSVSALAANKPVSQEFHADVSDPSISKSDQTKSNSVLVKAIKTESLIGIGFADPDLHGRGEKGNVTPASSLHLIHLQNLFPTFTGTVGFASPPPAAKEQATDVCRLTTTKSIPAGEIVIENNLVQQCVFTGNQYILRAIGCANARGQQKAMGDQWLDITQVNVNFAQSPLFHGISRECRKTIRGAVVIKIGCYVRYEEMPTGIQPGCYVQFPENLYVSCTKDVDGGAGQVVWGFTRPITELLC